MLPALTGRLVLGLDAAARSVRVARRRFAGELGALVEIAPHRQFSGRRAGPVSLLITGVAAVETRGHAALALRARAFRIDQRLHFIAPAIAFRTLADAAQVVQGAEDFRKPRQ